MGTLGVFYVPKMSKMGTYHSAYVQKSAKWEHMKWHLYPKVQNPAQVYLPKIES